MSGSAVDAAVDGLSAYLAAQVTGLNLLTEWPEANKKLVYPSATLTTGVAKRTPIQPEEIAVTTPDENNQVVQTLAIAHYDIPIQIDLWCRTKAERRQFLNAILSSFNKAELTDESPCGLSLQLTDYFNVYARYEIDTHNFRDDEIASQTQERRATISLLVNTREIAQRTMYAIISAAIVQQVDSSSGELTDDSQNTETNQIY